MKRIKKDRIDHLDDVDVYVEQRSLTKEEEGIISRFLRGSRSKQGLAGKKTGRKRTA